MTDDNPTVDPTDRAFVAEDVQVQNENQKVIIRWADGHASDLPITRLRGYCPCAECQGHGGEIKWIDNSTNGITGAEPVGRYALLFTFVDGHNTGIYRWETLRMLDPSEEDRWGPPEEFLRGP